MTRPLTMIGSPPCSSRWPAVPIAGRVLMASSSNAELRPNSAAVRALPGAISTLMVGAPSMRSSMISRPESSATAITIFQPFLVASAIAAFMAFRASAFVMALRSARSALAVESNAPANKTSAVETLSNSRLMFGFPRLYACYMASYHRINPASPLDIPSWKVPCSRRVVLLRCNALARSLRALRLEYTRPTHSAMIRAIWCQRRAWMAARMADGSWSSCERLTISRRLRPPGLVPCTKGQLFWRVRCVIAPHGSVPGPQNSFDVTVVVDDQLDAWPQAAPEHD